MTRSKILLSLMLGLAVSGCELFEVGGDVSFSIAATDPVSDPDHRLNAVVIAVSKLVFVSDSGDRETINFDPAEQIDLLANTRGDSNRLVTNEALPDARYTSVEITIDSDDRDGSASFVQYDADNSTAPLFVPDDQQDELTLPVDFEVEDGESTALTLQFELRKSLRRQSLSLYELHPSLRLVIDDKVGTISGTVAPSLVANGCNAAVYLFSGSATIPDDFDDSGVQPFSTAAVFDDGSTSNPEYNYSLDFLPVGSYKLALTCKADEEDPTTDDILGFSAETTATVEAGDTTTEDIEP